MSDEDPVASATPDESEHGSDLPIFDDTVADATQRQDLWAAVDRLPPDHPFKPVAEQMAWWAEDLEDALARSPLTSGPKSVTAWRISGGSNPQARSDFEGAR